MAEKAVEDLYLYKWFKRIEKGEDLRLDVTQLEEFVKSEMGFSVNNLTEDLKNIIPPMIIVFLRNWPGWQFDRDVSSLERYFKLKQYIRLKLDHLINYQYDVAVKELLKEKVDSFAPYTINVKCPPNLLNSMVFAQDKDDVIMKQHIGKKWEKLTTAQLIHWPYIEVQYHGTDLSFVRNSAMEYVRYLNMASLFECPVDESPLLESALEISQDKKCYSLEYLSEYVRQYEEILKKSNVSAATYEEITTILHHFLKDVKQIEQNNKIATKTQLRFRLEGNFNYIRNKKLLKNTTKTQPARLGFCELLTPKIELYVNFICIKQIAKGSDDDSVKFDFTEKLKKFTEVEFRKNLPTIYFKCCFCGKQYVGSAKKDILTHLTNEHKMEHPVRCGKCKRQFEVTNHR